MTRAVLRILNLGYREPRIFNDYFGLYSTKVTVTVSFDDGDEVILKVCGISTQSGSGKFSVFRDGVLPS